VEKQDLMQAVWPDTFVEETNLTKNIFILRQILGASDNGEKYIETIPKRGYRFVATVREQGSEPGLIEDVPLSVATTGIGRQSAPLGGPSVWEKSRWVTRRSGFLAMLLILLMAGLAGAFTYQWRRSRSNPPASNAVIRSIAVLPFKPLAPESQDEAFQMGMADTLIFKLSGLKRLSVRSINSVRKYVNPDQDPLAAGREQKVDFVLDSSLQRDGDRVRVRTRLLNMADGTAVWTYQCDEQYCANVFAMQDAISEKVAAALSLHLTGAERERLRKHHTENKEAYQLYLKGRYHLDKRAPKDYQKGIEYFQQAIRIDPNYALAYVGLAQAYQALGHGIARPKDVAPKAKEAITKALEIDEQLAEAHSVLGLIRNLYDWDRPGAERAHKRALELNPNSEVVHCHYAIFLMIVGRLDEALVEIDRALDLAPLSIGLYKDKGMILHRAGKYDLAIEQLQKALDLDPNFPTAHWWLMQVYEVKGDYDQAVEADLNKSFGGWGETPAGVAALREAYAVSGWKGYWRKKLDLAEEKAKRGGYANPNQFVPLYARLGEKDQAFAWMERSYQARDFGLNFIKTDPVLAGLRKDPRFTDMLRRIGLEP
jgi:TolB-like protein/predicted Zn-dependent protease